jgi:hypothetical protein
MKFNTLVVTLFAFVAIGCNQSPKNFEMKVERVDELKGFILKGISISGTVNAGCIANDAQYQVSRDGKPVLENTARILSVMIKGKDKNEDKPFNGEAAEGEYVTLYIPDGKKQDVLLGDLATSDLISCKSIVASH